MSNLREQICKELIGVAQRVELRIRTGSWDDNTYQDPGEATSRIMALIAEAMLSEEAVEAVAYCGELFPGWAKDTMTKEHRDASIGAARQEVNAALAAAGITGAGQEGGHSMNDTNTMPAADAVAEVIAEYDVLTKCLLEAVHEPRGPQVNKALDAWRQKYQEYRETSYTATCAPDVSERVLREYQCMIISGPRIHATMFLYGAAVALNTTIAHLLGLDIPSPRPTEQEASDV